MFTFWIKDTLYVSTFPAIATYWSEVATISLALYEMDAA